MFLSSGLCTYYFCLVIGNHWPYSWQFLWAFGSSRNCCFEILCAFYHYYFNHFSLEKRAMNWSCCLCILIDPGTFLKFHPLQYPITYLFPSFSFWTILIPRFWSFSFFETDWTYFQIPNHIIKNHWLSLSWQSRCPSSQNYTYLLAAFWWLSFWTLLVGISGRMERPAAPI